MFKKADIRKITIGLNKKELEELILMIGRDESVHISNDKWNDVELQKYDGLNESKTTALLVKIKSLLEEFNKSESIEIISETGEELFFEERNVDDDTEIIDLITEKVELYKDFKMESVKTFEELSNRLNELEKMELILKNIDELREMTFCKYVFGKVEMEIGVAEMQYAGKFYVRQYGSYIVGVTLPDYEKEMNNYLVRYGFKQREDIIKSSASYGEMIQHVFERIKLLKKREIIEIKNYEQLKFEKEDEFAEIYHHYKLLELMKGAKKNFLFSASTVFINGWIDFARIDHLRNKLRELCGNKFLLLFSSKNDNIRFKAPVRLKNSRFFKAFEILVKNIGIPGNREIDPTPIASIAYLIMFGVMFGDLGQGLVLALVGFFIKKISIKKELSETVTSMGVILIAAGLSSSLFGILYGSVFSNEHLIPALWFHPMENIMYLFFAAVMMGAVFIATGLLLNIINNIRSGDYLSALFSPHGVLGFFIYSGSILMFIRYSKFDIFPGMIELTIFIYLPLLVFLMRNILGVLFFGMEKAFPQGFFEYAIESIAEIIEMFSGFLGNTISFIRAGAFALSHTGLSIAIYTLAEIIDPGLFSPGAILVIIIGNIFIILLEGLVCGIQSLRLEYYEFFGKFFIGNGIEFQPFSLKKYIKNTGGI